MPQPRLLISIFHLLPSVLLQAVIFLLSDGAIDIAPPVFITSVFSHYAWGIHLVMYIMADE